MARPYVYTVYTYVSTLCPRPMESFNSATQCDPRCEDTSRSLEPYSEVKQIEIGMFFYHDFIGFTC